MIAWDVVAENRAQGEADMLVRAIAATTIGWFLRWVLDEDERRALREFRAAYVANANAQWWPEQHERFRQSERRLDAAEREMQRRGF